MQEKHVRLKSIPHTKRTLEIYDICYPQSSPGAPKQTSWPCGERCVSLRLWIISHVLPGKWFVYSNPFLIELKHILKRWKILKLKFKSKNIHFRSFLIVFFHFFSYSKGLQGWHFSLAPKWHLFMTQCQGKMVILRAKRPRMRPLPSGALRMRPLPFGYFSQKMDHLH